jgi:hypothetical protein
MTIGFKVNADIETGRCVMEVLDAGIGADDFELEVVLDVLC